MKKTIFIPISSAIILRNFGLIPKSVLKLLAQHAKVILIVPHKAKEQTAAYFVGTDILVEGVTVVYKRTKLQKLHELFVRHLTFTEGAQLFAYYGVRLDQKVHFFQRLLFYVKLFISKTFGKSNFIRNTLAFKLEMSVFTSKEVAGLFEAFKPDLVFTPNVHSELDLDVLREAKRRGVKSVGMSGSWDHFPKRFVPVRPDRLLAQNEPTKDEAIRYQDYVPQNITVVGSPYYDLFQSDDLYVSREEFYKRIHFDPKKKTLLFVSGGCYAPDDGDYVDMIVKAMENGTFSEEVQLYIRPYPGVEKGEHEKFDSFAGRKGIFIEWIEPKFMFEDPWIPSKEDLEQFLNLLQHSDVIINTVSSIAIEASAFLKPIINIQFDGYIERPYGKSLRRFEHMTHYRHVYDSNGGVLVRSEKEFIDAIHTFLQNPEYNRENIQKLKDTMCWRIDGKVSERIVEEILKAV